jgi:VWFA-related protein
MRCQLIATFLILTCAAPAYSQDRLVNLNVVALDSRGQPFSDLTADDFQIQDQGKHFKIAVFQKNDAKVQAAAPAALGPHEFSNRSSAAPPSVTLILLDLLNLAMDQQGYARTQLVNVLRRLESADYVYLYLLTVRGPIPVRGLPEAQPEASAGTWTQGVQARLEDAFSHVSRMTADMYAEDRVNLTYMALDALASRLAAFPGRKSIVWISHGVPMAIAAQNAATGTMIHFEPMLRQLSATLDSATISVYPVDDLSARGPTADKNLGVFAAQTGTAPVARGTGPKPQEAIQATTGNSDTLTQIAAQTGGRVHLDNNIGAALKEAMEDAQANYTIAYTPDEWDGKYHKVRVVCTRRGVRVLAKDGYFAYAPQTSTAEQEKAALQAAAWSPLDAAGIGIRAAIAPSAKLPQAVHLQVRIEAGDVQLVRQNDRYAGQLSVTYVAYDADGKQTPSAPAAFPFRMTNEQREGALKNGITLSPDLPESDAIQKIRVIVFDRNSNNIGSVTIPVAAADRSPARP